MVAYLKWYVFVSFCWGTSCPWYVSISFFIFLFLCFFSSSLGNNQESCRDDFHYPMFFFYKGIAKFTLPAILDLHQLVHRIFDYVQQSISVVLILGLDRYVGVSYLWSRVNICHLSHCVDNRNLLSRWSKNCWLLFLVLFLKWKKTDRKVVRF